MTDPISQDMALLASLDGLNADGRRHLDEAKSLLEQANDETNLRDAATNLGHALVYLDGACRAVGAIYAAERAKQLRNQTSGGDQ